MVFILKVEYALVGEIILSIQNYCHPSKLKIEPCVWSNFLLTYANLRALFTGSQFSFVCHHLTKQLWFNSSSSSALFYKIFIIFVYLHIINIDSWYERKWGRSTFRRWKATNISHQLCKYLLRERVGSVHSYKHSFIVNLCIMASFSTLAGLMLVHFTCP